MRVNDDIHFPVGITYVVVIDTNLYSGNFEREFAAFVANTYDEYGGEEEREQFAEDLNEVLQSVSDKLTTLNHYEYDDVQETIWPTPGRINDGVGNHRDAAEGEEGYPAYESVAIFFSKELTGEELAAIKERAEKFAETYESKWGSKHDKMVIKAVRQEIYEVQRSVSIKKTVL